MFGAMSPHRADIFKVKFVCAFPRTYIARIYNDKNPQMRKFFIKTLDFF